MSISKSVREEGVKIRERAYSDQLDRLLRRLGIFPVLYDAYAVFLNKTTDSVTTLTAAGVTANFHTDTAREARQVIGMRTHEQALLDTIIGELRPGDVFYDLGANIGTYTVLASQRLGGSNVVAFEPSPANMDRLVRNAESNDVAPTRQQIAVSNSSGSIELTAAGSTDRDTMRTCTLEAGDTISIPTATIDALVENGEVPAPTVVKMDIEGAEYRALQGMQESLNSIRKLYCEVHKDDLRRQGWNPQVIMNSLEAHGFDIEVTDEDRRRYHIIATSKQ